MDLSSFKPHRRAAHGDNIFGSLILTFPTAHTGGALALYPSEDEQHVFDTGMKLSSCAPYMGYAVFRGDVKHEILPVTSGHRIALLYDLSWAPHRTVPVPTSSIEQMAEWTSKPQTLLDDATVLPDGGLFCFGLENSYPVPTEDKLDLGTYRPYALKQHLCGADHLLFSSLEQLGLDPEVQMSYELLGYFGDEFARISKYATRGLINRPLDMIDRYENYERMELDELLSREGTITKEDLEISQVVWITPLTSATQLMQTSGESDDGKFCEVEHVFANFCIVARVKPYSERRNKLQKRKRGEQEPDEIQSASGAGKPRKKRNLS